MQVEVRTKLEMTGIFLADLVALEADLSTTSLWLPLYKEEPVHAHLLQTGCAATLLLLVFLAVP